MGADDRVTMARESLRLRALRARYFPGDIFAEYAWVVLLHAYLHGAGVAAADGGEAIAFDGQVMRHWLRYLEKEHLIVPREEPGVLPRLTAAGQDRMERYLDDLATAASGLA